HDHSHDRADGPSGAEARDARLCDAWRRNQTERHRRRNSRCRTGRGVPLMATMNATARLGTFAATAVATPLASDVATKAAICLLDSLGLAVAARDEPTAAAARSMTTQVSEGSRTAR